MTAARGAGLITHGRTHIGERKSASPRDNRGQRARRRRRGGGLTPQEHRRKLPGAVCSLRLQVFSSAAAELNCEEDSDRLRRESERERGWEDSERK